MARHLHQATSGRKVAAIIAALTVVGVGAVSTLASWTDSEWVFGSVNGDPGVGTSTFNVQQNTNPDASEEDWTDGPTNPGGELTFSIGALTLSPGDSVFAPVALRTESNSVGGSVFLQAAAPADEITADDDGDELWAAIEQAVATDDEQFSCDGDAFDVTSELEVFADGPLGTAAAAPDEPQVLDAAAGSTQHYCFKLTLPEGVPSSLQGRTIAPAWEFAAASIDQ